MSPVESRAKQRLHTRTITCECYSRADGMVDIEGRLVDIKYEPLDLPERGIVAPREAIHDMKLVITLDHDFVIQKATALTLKSPYQICGEINDSYRQLIGLKIAPGFTRQVKRMFRGLAGCTHLTELLPPMATTAFQVMWTSKEKFSAQVGTPDGVRAASPIGGCHALRKDGAVIKVYFPQHYESLQTNEGDV